MQLMGNRLLIKVNEPLEKTNGGIYIPDKLKTQRNVGTVMQVGTTTDKRLLGKDIMFNLQAGRNFSFENTDGKIIFVTDLIATLN